MSATMDHISARERRTDERFEVRLPATVRAYRLPTLEASLVDVSAGGAMIEADPSVYGIGEEVSFGAARIELVATIAWARGRFIGLAFHRRLAPHELGALRKASA